MFIILTAQFLKRDPGQIGLLPDGAEVKEETSSFKAGGLSLREAIRTRQFWMLCTMLACFLFILYTIMAHVVANAIELGISATIAANILATIGGFHIVGTLAIAPFANRVGKKRALAITFIMISVALFWLVVAREVWMLYLFAVIFGLAFGSLSVLISPLIAELFGLRSHGVIFGAINFAGAIGSTLGPVLTGRIFDITNSYQLAFLVGGVLGIIGLVLTLLIRPTSIEMHR